LADSNASTTVTVVIDRTSDVGPANLRHAEGLAAVRRSTNDLPERALPVGANRAGLAAVNKCMRALPVFGTPKIGANHWSPFGVPKL
jgi:hypothetical protein